MPRGLLTAQADKIPRRPEVRLTVRLSFAMVLTVIVPTSTLVNSRWLSTLADPMNLHDSFWELQSSHEVHGRRVALELGRVLKT